MIRRFFNKAIWLFVHKIPWKPILIWGPWVLALLIVAFYGIENWRGARTLAQAKQEAKAAGVSLKLSNYLPKRPDDVPDPKLLPGFDESRIPDVRKMIYDKRPGFEVSGIGKEAVTQPEQWKAERRNILNWLDPTLGIKSEQEAAKKLESLAPEFNILRKLVAEKENYPLVFSAESLNPTFKKISSESLVSLVDVTAALRDDITIATSARDNQRVFENISLMVDIHNSERRPTALSFFLQIVFTMACRDSIWEAIVTDSLTEEQLETIAQKLRTFSWDKLVISTIDGELAFSLASIEEAKRDREFLAENLSWSELGLFYHLETGWGFFDDSMYKIDESLLKRMPSGWLDLAAATCVTESLKLRQLAQTNLEAIGSYKPGKGHFPANYFTDEAIPLMINIYQKVFHIKAHLKLVEIGVALEIYKLKHGEYPKDIELIEGMDLTDPYTREIIGYRLKEDGTPLAWSVGANEINENGIPGSRKNEGDIVWMLTPISGMTETTWKAAMKKHRLE